MIFPVGYRMNFLGWMFYPLKNSILDLLFTLLLNQVQLEIPPKKVFLFS